MREITVASQIHLEKRYVKVLMKVLKGVAHRRFVRDSMRNHYHAWRHRTERKRSRAVLQRVFRLLLKVTVRRLHIIFDNWAWEAGHTRGLDRKCHVLALGSTWVEQTATITSSVRQTLQGGSAGRAVPRLRRLRSTLEMWKASSWTKHDAWRHRLLGRSLAHKVIGAWSNKVLDHRRIRHTVTLRLVSKLHTFGQELAREALLEWAHNHARRRQSRRAVVSVVRMLKKQFKKHCFQMWASEAHERRTTLIKLKRMWEKSDRQRFALAFHGFHLVTRHHRKRRRAVVSVVRMLIKARVVRCMARWVEWAHERRTTLVKLKRMWAKSDRQRFALAFHGFNLVTRHHRKRTIGVCTLLMRVSKRSKACYLAKWLDRTRLRRILTYKAKKILTWQYKRLMHSMYPLDRGLDVDTFVLDQSRLKETIAITNCLIHAFGHLRVFVRQTRRTAGLAARFFRGILGRSFGLWFSVTHQYQHLRHQYARGIDLMKPGFQRRVFKSWRTRFDAKKRLSGFEILLSRVTRKSYSRSAFFTWLDCANEEAWLRSFLDKWTGNRRRELLSKSMCTWTHWGHKKKWLRSMLTTSDDMRRRQVLSESLRTWADCGRYKAWLGSLMSTCFVYRKARVQRNCLREWGRFSCCSKWLAVTANKVQLRINHRLTAICVGLWSEYIWHPTALRGVGGMFATRFRERRRVQKILHAWLDVCRESLHSSLLFEIQTDHFRSVGLKRNTFEAWLECTDETLQLMKQKEQEDTLQILRKQEEEGKRLEVARQEQASQEQRLIKEQHRDKRLHQIAALLGRRSERAMLQHFFSGFWCVSLFFVPL